MDRRSVARDSVIGVASLVGSADLARKRIATLLQAATGEGPSSADGPVGGRGLKLFPTEVSGGEWVQFQAEGFSEPACGVVYRRINEVSHGMPLGGIGTGFINIETN